jgi:hypothetical protein
MALATDGDGSAPSVRVNGIMAITPSISMAWHASKKARPKDSQSLSVIIRTLSLGLTFRFLSKPSVAISRTFHQALFHLLRKRNLDQSF